MKKLFFFVFILLFLLFLPQKFTEAELPVMNVSIEFVPYYYIVISDKLWEGIFYTNETGKDENLQYPLTPGSSGNSAVWNYNKSNKKTEYWVFFDGNVKGDICHGATNHLCSTPGCGGENNVQINISNAKWSSSLLNTEDEPSLSNAAPFVIGFDDKRKVYSSITPKTTIYLRYWLDVPPTTPALTYNTTYQIRVVPEGGSCE